MEELVQELRKKNDFLLWSFWAMVIMSDWTMGWRRPASPIETIGEWIVLFVLVVLVPTLVIKFRRIGEKGLELWIVIVVILISWLGSLVFAVNRLIL